MSVGPKWKRLINYSSDLQQYCAYAVYCRDTSGSFCFIIRLTHVLSSNTFRFVSYRFVNSLNSTVPVIRLARLSFLYYLHSIVSSVLGHFQGRERLRVKASSNFLSNSSLPAATITNIHYFAPSPQSKVNPSPTLFWTDEKSTQTYCSLDFQRANETFS